VTANQFFVPMIAPGAGRRAHAREETVGENATELALLELQRPGDMRTRVALAPALVEAKKLETILEKAAELGCAAFLPVVSARSVRAPKERADRKLERWNRIVREAAEQCKGPLVTAVEPPRALKSFLRRPPAGLRLFLSEHGGRPLGEIVAGAPAAGRPAAVVLLVGPKGGWTGAEEKDIRAAGFTAVTLGRRILRAETAAVAAAAMIMHFWNEI